MGIIGNMSLLNESYPVHAGGTMNSHAVAEVIKRAPKMDKDQIIVMNLCGRGDKDIFTVAEALGVEIWIKRDDCTGLAGGGNKTRKLEFLIADALAKGADTLITVGAPQSNHCRLTLAAAAKEGLDCRLVIEERVAGSFSPDALGNNLLFDVIAQHQALGFHKS